MQNMQFKKDMDDMLLKQLGADTFGIYGIQCFVKFKVEGYEICYAYNINSENKYFLQRTKPYPMIAGTFENASDVVNSIKVDAEQFKNAIHSGNFQTFLGLNTQILELVRVLEDLFLYYNVDKKHLEELSKDIGVLKEKLLKCAGESERIYFGKEPESI